MKLASITLGAWQRLPNNAIAIPQRNTVTPVKNKTNLSFRLQTFFSQVLFAKFETETKTQKQTSKSNCNVLQLLQNELIAF